MKKQQSSSKQVLPAQSLQVTNVDLEDVAEQPRPRDAAWRGLSRWLGARCARDSLSKAQRAGPHATPRYTFDARS